MYCSKCGNLLRRDAQFCDKCGTAVQSQPSPVTPEVQAVPPRKRTSPAMWLLIIVCTCVGVWLYFGAGSGASGSSSTQSSGAGYAVYRITGTARNVSLTFSNVNDDSSQIARVAVPWDYMFQTRRGQFLYVSAQNNTEFGDVTCEIEYNGKVVKRSTSSGAYVIATCSDSAR